MTPGSAIETKGRHATLEDDPAADAPTMVPTLKGKAWIAGFATYVVDPEDPFPNGFTVGDIWGAQES